MDHFALRPPISSDQNTDSKLLKSAGTVAFKHPGYKELEDVLFELPRLDFGPQSQAPGVHHDTALLACQIVANNAFDGYLATDREGLNRASGSSDGILRDEAYWFIVGGEDEVYPVVPRFEEWAFPHAYFRDSIWNLAATATNESDRRTPATTAQTAVLPSAMPPPRTQRCILSNKSYSLHKAHLVPAACHTWFQVNSMKHYGKHISFIHNRHNIALIRQDLHSQWDSHVFALVPKGSEGEFAVHILNNPDSSTSEFAAEWHNRPVQKGALDNIAGAYLLAKFAQAVFMLFKPFVAFSGVPRHIATIQTRLDDTRHPYETIKEWVSPASLMDRYGGGGSRNSSASGSGRKRSRPQSALGDYLTEWYGTELWDSELEEELDARNEEDACRRMMCAEEDDEERGRPRKRLRRYDRPERTVDTLPSLTDSSFGDPEDTDPNECGEPAAVAEATGTCVSKGTMEGAHVDLVPDTT